MNRWRHAPLYWRPTTIVCCTLSHKALPTALKHELATNHCQKETIKFPPFGWIMIVSSGATWVTPYGVTASAAARRKRCVVQTDKTWKSLLSTATHFSSVCETAVLAGGSLQSGFLAFCTDEGCLHSRPKRSLHSYHSNGKQLFSPWVWCHCSWVLWAPFPPTSPPQLDLLALLIRSRSMWEDCFKCLLPNYFQMIAVPRNMHAISFLFSCLLVFAILVKSKAQPVQGRRCCIIHSGGEQQCCSTFTRDSGECVDPPLARKMCTLDCNDNGTIEFKYTLQMGQCCAVRCFDASGALSGSCSQCSWGLLSSPLSIGADCWMHKKRHQSGFQEPEFGKDW